MKIQRVLLLSLSAAIFAGCASSESNRDYRSLYKSISEKDSPEIEAEADFSSGDLRIYSAMGIGCYFPGLDYDKGSRIAAKHGAIMIAGSSDCGPESRAAAKYLGAAFPFAIRYNQKKAKLIE